MITEYDVAEIENIVEEVCAENDCKSYPSRSVNCDALVIAINYSPERRKSVAALRKANAISITENGRKLTSEEAGKIASIGWTNVVVSGLEWRTYSEEARPRIIKMKAMDACEMVRRNAIL